MVDTSLLETQVSELLVSEMGDEPNFKPNVMAVKVKLAVKDVMAKRRYENSKMTDEKILDELSTKYFTTIVNLARYDYNQSGAEGESNHSENSTSRSWVSRNDLLSDVYAFVKIF